MKLGLLNSAWVPAGRGTTFGIAKTNTIAVEREYSPDPAHIVQCVTEANESTAALLRAAGLRG